MDAKYHSKSLWWGTAGLVLQLAPIVFPDTFGRAGMLIHLGGVTASDWSVLGIGLTGSLLLLVGLAYYAKAKGRHPAWCLLAFLSLIGIVILATLEDRARGHETIAT